MLRVGKGQRILEHSADGLLEYHYWARDRLLDAVEPLAADQFVRELGNSFSSIRDTLVHLVSAESVWCSRWMGQSPPTLLQSADFKTLGDVRDRWQKQGCLVSEFVAELGPDGIWRQFRYTDPDGVERSSAYWHSIQHVVNHATFHRGQVTTMLRQVGARPPLSQDLVTFYRATGR